MSSEPSQTKPSLFVKEQSIETYDSQYSRYREVLNPKHIYLNKVKTIRHNVEVKNSH